MNFRALALPGAFVIELVPRTDARGHFMRVYDEALFAERGLASRWVQDNEAHNTRASIVRGLHFQRPPKAETKLVHVMRGAIWDVIVDLRRGSPTFARWEAVELSADNHLAMYVPRGFAHGYCTLVDDAVVHYKVDAAYAPELEGGLRHDDPALAIDWPVSDPLVSDKDRRWPTLAELETPFSWSSP